MKWNEKEACVGAEKSLYRWSVQTTLYDLTCERNLSEISEILAKLGIKTVPLVENSRERPWKSEHVLCMFNVKKCWLIGDEWVKKEVDYKWGQGVANCCIIWSLWNSKQRLKFGLCYKKVFCFQWDHLSYYLKNWFVSERVERFMQSEAVVMVLERWQLYAQGWQWWAW